MWCFKIPCFCGWFEISSDKRSTEPPLAAENVTPYLPRGSSPGRSRRGGNRIQVPESIDPVRHRSPHLQSSSHHLASQPSAKKGNSQTACLTHQSNHQSTNSKPLHSVYPYAQYSGKLRAGCRRAPGVACGVVPL